MSQVPKDNQNSVNANNNNNNNANNNNNNNNNANNNNNTTATASVGQSGVTVDSNQKQTQLGNSKQSQLQKQIVFGDIVASPSPPPGTGPRGNFPVTPTTTTPTTTTTTTTTPTTTPTTTTSTSTSTVPTSLANEFDAKTLNVFAHKGYQILRLLGHGAYGRVYEAFDTRNRQAAAVKVLGLNRMSNAFRKYFLPRELCVLISCRHPNLIQVFDIFRASNHIYIFMEFAARGDIAAYIRRKRKAKSAAESTSVNENNNNNKNNNNNEEYTEEEEDAFDALGCLWFTQTAAGLAYLHENMLYAHRDIKLDNMLLDERYVAKLTDFGFAKQSAEIVTRNVQTSRTYCGTTPYKCPQILRKQPYNAFKADVWSMGVALYVITHRRFPFAYQDRAQHLRDIDDYPRYIQSRYKARFAPEARQLLDSMFAPDETKRVWIKTVRHNRWLTEIAARAIVPDT